jgi:hypothetical protein
MSDEVPADVWKALEPTPSQRRRIEDQVFAWLEAHETSIVAEWLSLIRVRPLAGLTYAAAAAVSLLLLSPLGWLVVSVLA